MFNDFVPQLSRFLSFSFISVDFSFHFFSFFVIIFRFVFTNVSLKRMNDSSSPQIDPIFRRKSVRLMTDSNGRERQRKSGPKKVHVFHTVNSLCRPIRLVISGIHYMIYLYITERSVDRFRAKQRMRLFFVVFNALHSNSLETGSSVSFCGFMSVPLLKTYLSMTLLKYLPFF